ncbi:hypothetical protein ACIGW8_09705 [Streptomyces sioyaensis]|uniref:DUF7674 family protein n=1 Tax=Streptomyces sioyaensis TaxID=67364 RepID=UPI0037CF9737
MSTPTWWSELLGASQVLAESDRKEVREWQNKPDGEDLVVPTERDESDVPPLTARLGLLAGAFCKNVPAMPSEERRRVLGVLERIMATESREDRTAVGTGFLEPLLMAWDEGFDLRLIWGELGRESRSFCLALNEFWGVKSPDWMRGE